MDAGWFRDFGDAGTVCCASEDSLRGIVNHEEDSFDGIFRRMKVDVAGASILWTGREFYISSVL